ncbi:MAG: ribosomal RNA small subunit methyltransferase A [Chitinophagaceae bacterium]|nr:ribosomal RNA small subunit methyltransferase A [Chitinophagaceae bacterium]MCW5904704.1 ribosomal RNA small subunit methyltransferase A [Chitinophagaceae bacterium]
MQYTLKKSLGQHFLKNENMCKKIADAIEETLVENKLKHLLEVGPGAGAITKYLLQIPDINFKTVELDTEKVDYLNATYPTIQSKIIHQNFLEIDKPFDQSFMVAGNFPYNISSQILFKVLEWKNEVPVIIGMFQKEVALRVAAKPNSKTYGIISVLIQAFYDVTYLFDVPPTCFNPPPKVMSGVIKLTLKTQFHKVKSDAVFVQLVKTAFNQRRKMLRNAVKHLFDESILQDDFFNKRAEQLSVEDFAALTFKMK